MNQERKGDRKEPSMSFQIYMYVLVNIYMYICKYMYICVCVYIYILLFTVIGASMVAQR